MTHHFCLTDVRVRPVANGSSVRHQPMPTVECLRLYVDDAFAAGADDIQSLIIALAPAKKI